MNTDKKNQHYLPKFYLRNFSYLNNSKQIGIFNLSNDKYFQRASLKFQGSKNYYYGSDGIIEDKLAKIEFFLALAITKIIRNEALPKKFSSEYIDILKFVAYTDLRNPARIELTKLLRIEANKIILERNPNIDRNKLYTEIDDDIAVKSTLKHGGKTVCDMLDLEMKILVNRTSMPFITSDFPIVKCNPFLEKNKWKHGKTGYQSKGLQIYVPLNPKVTLLLYDQNVYKVGASKQIIIDLFHLKDVNQLNTLQFLNCSETIFFNDKASEQYARSIYSGSMKYKKANQVVAYNHNSLKKDDICSIKISECEIKLSINGIKVLDIEHIATSNQIRTTFLE